MAGLRKDLLAVVGVGVQLRNGEVKVSRGRPVRQPRPAMQELFVVFLLVASLAVAYDPEDESLATVLPPRGQFEAFYSRAFDVEDGSSRPAHGHASFYSARKPALVNAPNSAAYGFRFDGGRRFNYD